MNSSLTSPSLTELEELQASAERASTLLKLLANPDRLVLLCQLAQNEFCVSELEAITQIHQPTLSQQLGILRKEGVVEVRRDGKNIYYKLICEDVAALMKVLHTRLCGSKRSSQSNKSLV